MTPGRAVAILVVAGLATSGRAGCPGEPPWARPGVCDGAGCRLPEPGSRGLLAARRIAAPADTFAEEVCYAHDGLRLSAFVVRPDAPDPRTLPALLYLHGGMAHGRCVSREDPWYLARLAREGPFSVLAAQYRGHGGGDGADEIGGRDVGDVAELYRLANDRGWISPAPASATR